MQYLKNHPFAVEAFFENSTVLTFAMRKEQLQPLLPPKLELDTLKDTWAFLAVAMVKTKALRPKGFPSFLGNDFYLIGYRIFTRYLTKSGKRFRGLYILGSETDKRKMQLLGNIFTHYNYRWIDIQEEENEKARIIFSNQTLLRVEIEKSDTPPPLPPGSPFADWNEARRFSGPLPFTFTWLQQQGKMLIIEGVRQHWEPVPVKVSEFKIPFIENLGLSDGILANAFEIKNNPYYWKKGILD